jgi:hypothetical protein
VAKDCSFDVVSEVDLQEVDNAVNQALKEVGQRFDFRGSKSTITLDGVQIKVVSDDDHKLSNVVEILQSKIIKRGISLKNLDYGKVESGFSGTSRQIITVKKGLDKEKAKNVIAFLKTSKSKVQAQVQDDQVRVTGKNKDDLQNAIAELRQHDFDIALQFINFRS